MSSKTTDMLAAKTTVFAEDMSDEQLEEVINFAKEAFGMASIPASMKVFSAISLAIRTRMDKEYEKGWNVVVGTRFGA